MGLLESVFGSEGDASSTADDHNKYAVLLNAGPESVAVAGNAFNYAVELDEAGHDVEIYLDGKATQWPAEFAENPDRPFSHHWEAVKERDLLTGACGYCANAFDAAEACTLEGVDLLSGKGQHAPSVGELADRDYEFLTIG
jgi:hypothetical protein